MNGALPSSLGAGTALPPAPGPRESTTALGLASLRDKGRLALLGLVAFLGLLTALAWYEMQAIQTQATALERARVAEARLHDLSRTAHAAEVDAAVAQANQAYAAGAERLAAHFERLRDLGGLGIVGQPDWLAAVQRGAASFERFRAEPGAQSLDSLRSELTRLGHVLDEAESAAERASAQVAQALHQQAGHGAWVTLGVAVGGSALFGLALTLFMSHLAVDLTQLRHRALQILAGAAQGSPPPPLPAPAPRPAFAPFASQAPSARHDEVGHLAASLEHLAGRLAAQQRDLEIERRNVFNQEKSAALGALAAGVLDEIGNPIAAIDGYARTLAAQAADAIDGTDAADVRDHARAIVREVERLNGITHDMAILAAPQASDTQLVSLNELVTLSLGLLRFDARLRGIRVEAELDPNLSALSGRADQLVQLVMNLVINAADAIREGAAGREGMAGRSLGRDALRGSLVRVSTLTNGKITTLTVADNGCGMNEEVRRRAFEPLFTTKPAGLGTGLGLPLCKAIAAGHGGSIELDSAPGRGTTVNVVLPNERP